MVRRSTTGFLLFASLALATCTLRAQDNAVMERMENELCGCMSMIDTHAKDAAFDQQVRDCLEDAVVHHPAAMNTLLQEAKTGETRGYQLGEILGRHLEPRCPALRAIRIRLQRSHPSGGLLKSAS